MSVDKKGDTMAKKINEYVESQAKAARPIKINDLVCFDCVFRNEEREAICEKFPMGVYKPGKVLRGGECDEYKKE